MRFIRETLFRIGWSVTALGLYVFCGLVAAVAMLIKGEDGSIEAIEFNKRIIG